MALIKCPECGNEVSSSATACPKCGYPIARKIPTNTTLMSSTSSAEDCAPFAESFPSFPTLMDVGKQLSLFSVPEITDGYFVAGMNNVNYIPEGKVRIAARTNGISIHSGMTDFFPISYEQIIEMKNISHKQLSAEDKSIIGRAAAGWLLMGPAGAVVGGLTGLGAKTIGNYLFIISFWDVYTHQAQAILICTKKPSTDFIKACESEKTKNNTPDASLYVCNILDDRDKISDKKAMDVLKRIGELELSLTIQRIEGCDSTTATEKINQICSRNNVDFNKYKDSGCVVTLFVMMSGLLSFAYLVYIII